MPWRRKGMLQISHLLWIRHSSKENGRCFLAFLPSVLHFSMMDCGLGKHLHPGAAKFYPPCITMKINYLTKIDFLLKASSLKHQFCTLQNLKQAVCLQSTAMQVVSIRDSGPTLWNSLPSDAI